MLRLQTSVKCFSRHFVVTCDGTQDGTASALVGDSLQRKAGRGGGCANEFCNSKDSSEDLPSDTEFSLSR